MFRVIVVAGVSLAACGGNEDQVITNPPAPNPTDAGTDAFADGGRDAAADAPSSDASDASAADAADAMPIIR